MSPSRSPADADWAAQSGRLFQNMRAPNSQLLEPSLLLPRHWEAREHEFEKQRSDDTVKEAA
jgi:hypothetical protein